MFNCDDPTRIEQLANGPNQLINCPRFLEIDDTVWQRFRIQFVTTGDNHSDFWPFFSEHRGKLGSVQLSRNAVIGNQDRAATAIFKDVH